MLFLYNVKLKNAIQVRIILPWFPVMVIDCSWNFVNLYSTKHQFGWAKTIAVNKELLTQTVPEWVGLNSYFATSFIFNKIDANVWLFMTFTLTISPLYDWICLRAVWILMLNLLRILWNVSTMNILNYQ